MAIYSYSSFIYGFGNFYFYVQKSFLQGLEIIIFKLKNRFSKFLNCYFYVYNSWFSCLKKNIQKFTNSFF